MPYKITVEIIDYITSEKYPKKQGDEDISSTETPNRYAVHKPIYTQTVDTIQLENIIRAVNGISMKRGKG